MDEPQEKATVKKIFAQWVEDRAFQIRTALRDAHPTGREPTVGEVYKHLDKYISDLNAHGEHNYKVPSRPWLYKFFEGKPLPDRDPLETPWDLGKSKANSIPDEATGALMKVWAWVITDAVADPFTLRMAKWVCKLRWIPEAGGSPHGEVIEPEHMYMWAGYYSAREYTVETVRGEEPEMATWSSGRLDTELMLSPNVASFVRRLGLHTDDASIDHDEEFSALMPRYKLFLDRAMNGYISGLTPAQEKSADVFESMFEKFDELEADANQMFNVASRELTIDERYKQYKNLWPDDVVFSAYSSAMEEILRDLFEAYTEGWMDSWEPDIEGAIQRHILGIVDGPQTYQID
jgi:hypothetical protein